MPPFHLPGRPQSLTHQAIESAGTVEHLSDSHDSCQPALRMVRVCVRLRCAAEILGVRRSSCNDDWHIVRPAARTKTPRAPVAPCCVGPAVVWSACDVTADHVF